MSSFEIPFPINFSVQICPLLHLIHLQLPLFFSLGLSSFSNFIFSNYLLIHSIPGNLSFVFFFMVSYLLTLPIFVLGFSHPNFFLIFNLNQLCWSPITSPPPRILSNNQNNNLIFNQSFYNLLLLYIFLFLSIHQFCTIELYINFFYLLYIVAPLEPNIVDIFCYDWLLWYCSQFIHSRDRDTPLPFPVWFPFSPPRLNISNWFLLYFGCGHI